MNILRKFLSNSKGNNEGIKGKETEPEMISSPVINENKSSGKETEVHKQNYRQVPYVYELGEVFKKALALKIPEFKQTTLAQPRHGAQIQEKLCTQFVYRDFQGKPFIFQFSFFNETNTSAVQILLEEDNGNLFDIGLAIGKIQSQPSSKIVDWYYQDLEFNELFFELKDIVQSLIDEKQKEIQDVHEQIKKDDCSDIRNDSVQKLKERYLKK